MGAYQITGIQLILDFKQNAKVESEYTCLNFRSLLNSEIYNDLTDQIEEYNYNNKLTLVKAKQIDQHDVQGVFVESQFKHQIRGDLTSDYVNSRIFDNNQSYQLLRETNVNALNSFPNDFVGLMDVREINNEWLQRDRTEFNIEDMKRYIPLKVEDILYRNYKRYFNAWEFMNGFQILN